jgi:hypothetical protein
MKKVIIFLILFFSTFCFAANEIRFYDANNQHRYCQIIQTSTLYYWNTPTSTFIASPTWANSAIDLTESIVGRCYYATFPSSTAGLYEIPVYNGTKATATNTDALAGGIELNWSGTTEIRQTGDSYAIVNNTDYGNAKLVRSGTPANPLKVNSGGGLAVVADVNVIKWGGVVVAAPTAGGLIKVVDSNGAGLPTWVQANEFVETAAAILKIIYEGGTGDANAIWTAANAIKAKTDGLNFSGNDVKATLDGETVDVGKWNGTDVAAPTAEGWIKVVDTSGNLLATYQQVLDIADQIYYVDLKTQYLPAYQAGTSGGLPVIAPNSLGGEFYFFEDGFIYTHADLGWINGKATTVSKLENILDANAIPSSAAGTNGGLPTVDAGNRVKAIKVN